MGSKGPSDSTLQAQQQISQEQVALAEQQNARANTLFTEVGLPGLKTAKSYYDKLASGDPTQIQAAVGPAEAQIDAQTAGTIKNIQDTMPRGGTKLLGEEEAKIQGAGEKGNLITQAYTSAFPAEAQLGSGGAGLSIQSIAQAIQGFQGAGTTQAQIGSEQAAGKAAQLGFFGSLAGAGASLAGMCWIAERIFGRNDVRTFAVRCWLRRFAERPVGRIVVWAYRNFGRAASRSAVLCWMLTPLFEKALECAMKEMI